MTEDERDLNSSARELGFRWHEREGDAEGGHYAENEKVEAFLADLLAVYVRHGLSLSHEDQHGSFVVVPLSEAHVKWLLDATVRTPL